MDPYSVLPGGGPGEQSSSQAATSPPAPQAMAPQEEVPDFTRVNGGHSTSRTLSPSRDSAEPQQMESPLESGDGLLGSQNQREREKHGRSKAWSTLVNVFRDPVNIALAAWVLLAAPACALSVLLKLGLLRSLIPDQDSRDKTDESCMQLVNALFVLACLIGFPLLCRHAFLLLRWLPRDKLELRQSYCKNARRKPHERLHIGFVVFWGQLTCWATFLFAGFYWFRSIDERPYTAVVAINVVAKLACILSFLHLLISPLSRDYDMVKVEDEATYTMLCRTNTFVQSHRQVEEATWSGTAVPGCCEDREVAFLTCLFPCCMFGYNMERLGFGHMVVQSLAFFIVLFGPLFVFMLSAKSLRKIWSMEQVLDIAGAALALSGLLYGGAWRIRMRETFQLPGSRTCCNSERCTDLCLWMWCCYCALCQEIRTTNQYDVEQQAFYIQARGGPAARRFVLVNHFPESDVDIPALPGHGRASEALSCTETLLR